MSSLTSTHPLFTEGHQLVFLTSSEPQEPRPTLKVASSLRSPSEAHADPPRTTSTLLAAILRASWSLTAPRAPPTAAWTALTS